MNPATPPPSESPASPKPAEAASLPSPLLGDAEPSGSGSGSGPPPRRRLKGKRIALCVTGSIAAYKSAVLLRLLLKEGAEVEVILSRSATEFVGAATFAGLTGKTPFSEMFAAPPRGEPHVDLAARSDLVLVAPATADVIARLANGRSDDLVTALALCAQCPVLIAPAMHPSMWDHPATQRNVSTLAQDARASFIGPTRGEVASGDVGLGRMAEPEVILGFVAAQLTPRSLRQRHLVITAGPTAEDIDPVRTLSNRSSGKMGFAIAERAALHGAKVTLIAGPVALPTPLGVTRIDVRSALAMRSALWQALHLDLSGADALIMTAAVSDYRPARVHASKLKRTPEALTLELVPNPDLLAEIGAARRGEMPLLVGFALETESEDRLLSHAREKLSKKRVDLVFANHADESLGLDHVRARLVTPRDLHELASMPKEDAADVVLDWVASRLREMSR